MPFFKSTLNILKEPDRDEIFDWRFLETSTPYLPPNKEWDYNREMQIEDVDIWEVLYEASGGLGVYAAWSPYAEFYMVTTGWRPIKQRQRINDKIIETYYGSNAQLQVFDRAKQLGIHLNIQKIWKENEEMWLYNKHTTSEL